MDKNIKLILYFFIIISFIHFINAAIIELDENKDKNINFIIFGHVYPDYDVLKNSIDLILKNNPDFIVFLGDTVRNDYLNYIKGWETIKSITNKINVPIIFVPGNHDIGDIPESKIYFEKNISNLYWSFTENNNTFIFLNSVMSDREDYDISTDQISFLKSIYEKDDNNKFIFMHNCLFYKDNNQLCNFRGNLISKNNNWNKYVVPLIQKNTIVFVGDVGKNQPYFSYSENNINYFGVGFSFNKLKIPHHMLKVEIKDNSYKITPIPLEQDLKNIYYDQTLFSSETKITSKIKQLILNNIRNVILFLFLIIMLLSLIIIYLFFKFRQ